MFRPVCEDLAGDVRKAREDEEDVVQEEHHRPGLQRVGQLQRDVTAAGHHQPRHFRVGPQLEAEGRVRGEDRAREVRDGAARGDPLEPDVAVPALPSRPVAFPEGPTGLRSSLAGVHSRPVTIAS